ncbi:MAG: hypothetical protein ACD_16C00144G0006, partial [uncultured bacterium]
LKNHLLYFFSSPKAHIKTFGHTHPRGQEILLYLDKNKMGVPL